MITVHMRPEEFRRIRLNARLSLREASKVLRIADLSTVHRWERGEGASNNRAISGPVSILMELIDRGELPDRYFDCLEA
jgi:DNA-binding transcriptional regulator YiaG